MSSVRRVDRKAREHRRYEDFISPLRCSFSSEVSLCSRSYEKLPASLYEATILMNQRKLQPRAILPQMFDRDDDSFLRIPFVSRVFRVFIKFIPSIKFPVISNWINERMSNRSWIVMQNSACVSVISFLRLGEIRFVPYVRFILKDINTQLRIAQHQFSRVYNGGKDLYPVWIFV